MKIVITTTGHVRLVNNDEVLQSCDFGVVTKRRASHVEPCGLLLRHAFRLLRRWFGDSGRMAAFTRRWPCLWRVDLAPSGGPVLGPYVNRDCAIHDEVDYLERNVL